MKNIQSIGLFGIILFLSSSVLISSQTQPALSKQAQSLKDSIKILRNPDNKDRILLVIGFPGKQIAQEIHLSTFSKINIGDLLIMKNPDNPQSIIIFKKISWENI